MPNKNQNIPVAVCTSDWHLSLNPPIARSGEKDWVERQFEAISQILSTAAKLEVPVLLAGDVFDKWNAPVELVNRVCDRLSLLEDIEIYAIPGQHDLPYHNIFASDRSAFGSLLRMLPNMRWTNGQQRIRVPAKKDITLVSANWGCDIPEAPNERSVFMTHRYIWSAGTGYIGAERKDNAIILGKELKSYKAAIFGDNHTGFISGNQDTTIFNCGTIQRRTVREISYTPRFGILMDDFTFGSVNIDTSLDVISSPADVGKDGHNDYAAVIASLNNVFDAGTNFVDIVKHYINNNDTPKEVVTLLLEAIRHGEER